MHLTRRRHAAEEKIPLCVQRASASHYARGSDITQQDLDDFGQEGVWVDEEDLGGMDLASENALESTVYTRVDNSDSPPRPTYRQLYVTPPNTARREGYLKYITLDAELRKSLRAKLFGRFLEFRRDSTLHLRPLVSEDDLDDHDAPPPCACNCILTREIILYDVTAWFISSTASMPMTAFSFRLVEQAHASWKVSPRALTGYADGLKEYYSGCGWGRGHYTGHPWDKDLRKQLQRAIDEYRALVTCEKDSGDLLVGTVDSYPNKCPAYFGPTRLNQPCHHVTLDCVLAYDGNFQQTREKNSKHDVQGIVPDIFLAEEEVQAMKAEVEASVRPTKKACTESWKVADDGAGSTSSRVVDTGLVACVCRHDVNLKMVNLERSGEKLYYALAILKHISERLPENAKIGVLYDIACNFKHHIEKRQLLPKLFKRLEFATSVFHAYAHIWSCQVEFNPRLIPNFGLTDGEGCERLWSGLRSLIPINRPSNKSHRFVNLAVRIQALNDATVNKLGAWFYRRYHEANDKGVAAEEELNSIIAYDSRLTEDALRREWEEQRLAQVPKTAAQQSEADRLRESDLYGLVESLYKIESRIARFRRLGIAKRQTPQPRDGHRSSGNGTGSLCHGPLVQRSVENFDICASALLPKFHLEVIAYKTSREKLLSTGRGKGGAKLGQRAASRARATDGKIHSGAEKARKTYNKAVEAFRLAMGSTPSSLLNNLHISDSLKSAIDLDETDPFWQDGFFTHVEAAWAVNPWVKRGVTAVRAKDRVGEEKARIGAEVRQALAWLEDEKTRLTSYQTLWTNVSGKFSIRRAPYHLLCRPNIFQTVPTDTLPESIDPADAKSIFSTEDVEEIRGRALIILDRRMELLQLRECSWSQNDHFFDVWLETRGQSEGQSEPMPPALSELRGLHQRLNATGRTVKKAKHHQRPVHNRSGTRVRAIEAQMDMSDGAEVAKEVGPLSAQLLEKDGEMGSSSDESYGDDFAGQEDEYFSDREILSDLISGLRLPYSCRVTCRVTFQSKRVQLLEYLECLPRENGKFGMCVQALLPNKMARRFPLPVPGDFSIKAHATARVPRMPTT
ncbi:BZ3500_MvSof-1268-A1-R1_Chr1-3g01554 [Microbotryum saponariae]|uniref:BZ3500_MvSof-1268-A1-R1_Chr1-3g01554 protein n=1 Tax=Microbotryum saponariae TaxID=289078 RepID=A0A2X0KMC6_9BASI|nr:BZ3500_MvSof-1268-A1-R1_Chr1-3g01554 [Microbotryum saponariae]SCZ94017.1 BZ3501_MvSof-1269-A2-R1_Chr1-3g01156 [Microbotryum saponariae]